MQDWTTAARELAIGLKRKVECCSHKGPTAYISNGHKGVSLYCFRCGRNEFEPHGERSIAEVLATRQALDALATAPTPTMPKDAVDLTAGPKEGWLWVLQGGLTPEEATERWGFRWHEKTRRVLIPVPGGLLGRSVHGELPKYRMLTNQPGALYWPQKRPHRAVVAVEDILSAIAINRAGWAAVAVLGTSISPTQAEEIAEGREMVVGWFDGDPAGDKAWTRLRKRMALFPVTTHRITTQQDPKRLHRAALRDMLAEIGA